MAANSLSEAITTTANNIQTSLHVHGSAKPHLVFAATPSANHTLPIIRIAEELIQRGYTASFLTTEELAPKITSIGATLALQPDIFTEELMEARAAIPSGPARFVHDMEKFFIGPIPARWSLLKALLEDVRKTHGSSREVVCVVESAFLGHLPLVTGAALPEGYTTRPRVVNLSCIPYIQTSIDTPPFGLALPPDSSDFGRSRNTLLAHAMGGSPPMASLAALQASLLDSVGATQYKKDGPAFYDAWTGYDAFVQLCTPSVEYPRSDFVEGFRFAGSLPARHSSKPDADYPAWWADVKRGDKKVIMVSQGTISTSYDDLVVPTIKALAGRDDLLVIAVLGVKGATLPADSIEVIPDNARVVDYFSYDDLLRYTACFVVNAGYGGFLHGIINGVPMVLAGVTEDHPDVAARGAWAGVGVDLKSGRPSEKALREGVDTILGDPKFKERVLEVKRENDALDTVGIVEEAILGK